MDEEASLEGSVAWVVGGVGIIAKGICRGLLRAGATVVVNSRFQDRLDWVTEELGKPANLITVRGTMQPEGAEELVRRAMQLPELAGRRIEHVVAHTGVRWWDADGASDETQLMEQSRTLSLVDMGPEEFARYAARLPALQQAAAQQLLPHLRQAHGGSYTFVNGGAGLLRASMDQVNLHGVWGLAVALREELKDSNVRVEEMRVGLQIDRLAKEKLADPRPTPLSHDIGRICAGIALNWHNWPRKKFFYYHKMNNNDDILMLKLRYPHVTVQELP